MNWLYNFVVDEEARARQQNRTELQAQYSALDARGLEHQAEEAEYRRRMAADGIDVDEERTNARTQRTNASSERSRYVYYNNTTRTPGRYDENEGKLKKAVTPRTIGKEKFRPAVDLGGAAKNLKNIR